PKLTQEDGIHQLSNTLGHFSRIGLFRYFEEDDLGRSLCVNEIEQIANACVAELFLEQLGELAAEDLTVLQGVAEVLGERTFAGPKEPRYPHSHAFVRITRRLSNGFEEMMILFTNTIGRDVFRDF